MDVERITETQMSESWMLLNRYVTGISLSSIPTGKSQMSFRGLQRCGGGLSRVLGSTCQAFAIHVISCLPPTENVAPTSIDEESELTIGVVYFICNFLKKNWHRRYDWIGAYCQ